MSLRSPIGRVLGLGTAKEGVGHWWSQRVTAVALAILTLWFAFGLIALPDFQHVTVLDWIAVPFNSVLLLLLIGTAVYHSQLGVQVVIEDYVSGHGLKIASMLLINFVHVAVAALGIFAVLKIAFSHQVGAGAGIVG